MGWDSVVGTVTHHGLNGPGIECGFQRTSGLRRVSAAARLLVLRVRIPPGAWMFVLYSKDRRQNASTIKTKKQVRKNY